MADTTDICSDCGLHMDEHDLRSFGTCPDIWHTFMVGKEMPEGFFDSSYGNDACPSIAHESDRVYVWFHDEFTWADIGWKHPMVKYQVVAHPKKRVYGESWGDTIQTDTNDWNEALQAINKWRETARKMVRIYPETDPNWPMSAKGIPSEIEFVEFTEWDAYQAVIYHDGKPTLYFTDIKPDGSPDIINLGETEFFWDSHNSDYPFDFLGEINAFFGTSFTINNFPMVRGK